MTGSDLIISSTGKISRELFEIREENNQGHQFDFLTVGSMGHTSSIALSIALQKPHIRVWCVDGDGAALMHMGALAIVGTKKPKNLVHVVLNNGAHESVGGLPTAAFEVKLSDIAAACGYIRTYEISEPYILKEVLQEVKDTKILTFIEIRCGIKSRADLGRPTTTAIENKIKFMGEISGRQKNGQSVCQ